MYSVDQKQAIAYVSKVDRCTREKEEFNVSTVFIIVPLVLLTIRTFSTPLASIFVHCILGYVFYTSRHPYRSTLPSCDGFVMQSSLGRSSGSGSMHSKLFLGNHLALNTGHAAFDGSSIQTAITILVPSRCDSSMVFSMAPDWWYARYPYSFAFFASSSDYHNHFFFFFANSYLLLD
ncbi:unnamed protein product [Cylicocyclus nassatus]|uniref:Uncharacterized protein n=1 Tax=Cylicocyclus nassatus TaxID=53992 RepID=A0AA36GSD0_CYLNA|nr:unnamed protein product [Cylicocyclus nassatus]